MPKTPKNPITAEWAVEGNETAIGDVIATGATYADVKWRGSGRVMRVRYRDPHGVTFTEAPAEEAEPNGDHNMSKRAITFPKTGDNQWTNHETGAVIIRTYGPTPYRAYRVTQTGSLIGIEVNRRTLTQAKDDATFWIVNTGRFALAEAQTEAIAEHLDVIEREASEVGALGRTVLLISSSVATLETKAPGWYGLVLEDLGRVQSAIARRKATLANPPKLAWTDEGSVRESVRVGMDTYTVAWRSDGAVVHRNGEIISSGWSSRDAAKASVEKRVVEQAPAETPSLRVGQRPLLCLRTDGRHVGHMRQARLDSGDLDPECRDESLSVIDPDVEGTCTAVSFGLPHEFEYRPLEVKAAIAANNGDDEFERCGAYANDPAHTKPTPASTEDDNEEVVHFWPDTDPSLPTGCDIDIMRTPYTSGSPVPAEVSCAACKASEAFRAASAAVPAEEGLTLSADEVALLRAVIAEVTTKTLSAAGVDVGDADALWSRLRAGDRARLVPGPY
jgi:hypothetical protein